MPIFEPGKCDTGACITDYIKCSNPTGCTFGNCQLEGQSSLFTIPNTIPIKAVLKGSSVSPWVRLRFESDLAPDGTSVPSSYWDYTEITTGNISQPGNSEICRASIKSFQFGWGTIDQGNKCRVTIVDEKGSSLNHWIRRIFRNPRNTPTGVLAQQGYPNGNDPTIPQGVYKMKITFGWLVLGGEEGNECPIDGSFYGPASCTPSYTTTADGVHVFSDRPARLICSPPLWFLPNELNVTTASGKYVYELEGIDPVNRASEQPSARVYGSDTNKIHLGLAIKKLASEAFPPFEVDFLQLGPPGSTRVEPLLFNIPINSAACVDISTTSPLTPGAVNLADASCLIRDIPLNLIPANGGRQQPIPGCIGNVDPNKSNRRAFERLGPLSTWRCHELNALATIHRWINTITAQGVPIAGISGTPPPRGIIMNYDPTFREVVSGVSLTGKLILWANPHPHCAATVYGRDHIKAAYIVNGGACSPVLGFNPTVKWNFQALPASGGGMGPTTGHMVSMQEGRQALRCSLPGRGPRVNLAVDEAYANQAARAAPSNQATALAANRLANTLHHAIEAELKIQGDPSDYFCTPAEGFGRSLALVVINPFYIEGDDTNGCSASWQTLTSSSCNSVLTNDNWFIRGVDHQIKDGSFVTTIKVVLYGPNSGVNPAAPVVPGGGGPAIRGPVGMGGRGELPVGVPKTRFACEQGTNPCLDASVEFTEAASTPYGYRGFVAYPAGPVGTAPDADEFCDPVCLNTPGVD